MAPDLAVRRAMIDNIERDQLIAAIVWHLRMTLGTQGGTLREAYSQRLKR